MATKFGIPLPPIPPATGGAQEARPTLSDVKTLPTPGEPPVIMTCPAISRRALGVVIPIPRLPIIEELPVPEIVSTPDPRILPVRLIFPATSNLWEGVIVPIPMLPVT
ncbi:MAG: hypothetical protein DDT19_01083 [Syntrophomonadaceae bacterium]|nr:hypothetical protein [Bacillota bacterium]